jgi:hypothetical protein
LLPDVISFRAKSPRAKLKAEMVARFVVEPEAFNAATYFSNPKNGYSPWSEFRASLLGRLASNLDQRCL